MQILCPHVLSVLEIFFKSGVNRKVFSVNDVTKHGKNRFQRIKISVMDMKNTLTERAVLFVFSFWSVGMSSDQRVNLSRLIPL